MVVVVDMFGKGVVGLVGVMMVWVGWRERMEGHSVMVVVVGGGVGE